MILPRPLRYLVTATLLAALLQPGVSAQDDGGSLGAAPSHLEYGDALRGEPVTRFVKVQNMRDDPVRVTFEREGELAEWVRPGPGEPFTLPAKTTREVPLILEVPADAPNGAYEAVIRVLMQPGTEIEEGHVGYRVGVAVGIDLSARVTGDEVVRAEAGNLAVGDSEVGAPVTVRMWFRNLGNVRITPEVDVRVVGNMSARHYDDTHRLAPVHAGEEALLTLRVTPEDVAPGQYTLNATVRVRGETLYAHHLLFHLFAEGELRTKGQVGLVATSLVDDPTPTHRLPAGSAWRLSVPFTNEGELDVDAQFKGHVTRDGQIVRNVDSGVMTVAPGENATLGVLVTDVLAPGTYHVIGRVHYAGKVTDEVNYVVNLIAEGSLIGKTPGPGLLLVLAGALSVAGLLAPHAGARGRCGQRSKRKP